MPYTSPLSAKITTTVPVTWSDGSLFSGYILFGIALPTDSLGAQWAELRLWGTSQRLPLWVTVPVVEGQVDTNTTLFYTNQMDPPNTRYSIYWFDMTWKRIYPIGSLPALISVTANPYVVTQPTLAAPGVPGAGLTPDPQTPFSTNTSGTGTYLIENEYILTGTADGVNATFTLPVTPVITAFLFIDGQKQDPANYLRTGPVVIFSTPPTAGASVSALVA